MIYFIQAEGVGAIKIGFVEGDDPAKRLSDLQVGSPCKLSLLGTLPGGRDTEGELHRKFAWAHSHGEWFRPVPELLDFIGRQPADSRQGPAEVQTRFVQVKVLTVGRKAMTAAFLKQLKREDVVDWDGSLLAAGDFYSGPLMERGQVWGLVRMDGTAKIIWQTGPYGPAGSELRVWPIDPEWRGGPLFCCKVAEDRRRWKVSDEAWDNWQKCRSRAGPGYDPVALMKASWEASLVRWRQLEQLFVGVG